MRFIIAIWGFFCCALLQAQIEIYPHQEHKQLAEGQPTEVTIPNGVRSSSKCELDYVFYGFHPYWKNGKEVNYNWNLISHFSYFDYEVNPGTGLPSSTHGFETAASVTTALSYGKKVTLTVTCFGNADNTTLLSSSSAKQALITKLIQLISNRGAHGVCIDFEGIPASQRTNFTNFMIDLSTQMRTQIPNAEISTVLYSVDWSSVIDVAALNDHVDYFIIMAYDYYWSGSSTAGPNSPLYSFEELSYSRTVSRSITDYLNAGASKEKLICALPFYGRKWKVTTSTIPSPSTGSSGSAPVFFDEFKDNVNGYYSVGNRNIFYPSEQTYYNYYISGQLNQLFIDDAYSFGKKLKHIRSTGIAGSGAWALGFCDGYNDLWDQVEYYLTNCYQAPCRDTIYDFGGPLRKTHNNEDYIVTLTPDTSRLKDVEITFSSMNLEAGYDFLYIYKGKDTLAPQVLGSPFTGTTLPDTIIIDTNFFTYRLKTDGGVKSDGFSFTYQCFDQPIPPVDTISDTTIIDTGNNPVDTTETSGIVENSADWFTFYPNPTANNVFIDANFNGAYTVIGLSGEKIITGKIIKGINSVDLTNLSNGTYFMLFERNHQLTMKKLIKLAP